MNEVRRIQPDVTEGTPHRAGRAIIRIATVEADATIRFAAEELVRYLQAITGATAVHVRMDAYAPQPETLWVGTAAALGGIELPRVDNPELDDAIAIAVEGRHGVIAGANPRAALIAVYRYLFELGCRWVRPGADGELIPAIEDPLAQDVRVSEAPSHRHRGLAIEGACSCEHVIDLIDWLPKVGMNTYFIEYFAGYIFYNNWYSQRHLPARRKDLMPEERANEFAECAIEQIKRRGLLFHRAGHGWTCIPLGITPDLWDEQIDRDFGEMTQYLALYEGERKLYLGIPRRTNLCYSQREVRRMVVEGIVDYARAHPEVDYLHFWLADGSNHYCECDECRKARPSDFYVMMLNELDEALAAEGLPTRIVFLIYLDLLWPPERETIANPDRFVMMFAPLHRSYYEPFDPAGMDEPMPEFVLNGLEFPRNQNLHQLAAWQRVFDGDSFIFDYRFMWGQYDDPGYMAIAATIVGDMPVMPQIGINGMVSDQSQRVFLPSGLPMTLMGRMLWDSGLDYAAATDDYFAAAFGPDWRGCREYLEGISQGFEPQWLSTYQAGSDTPVPERVVEALRTVRTIISAFRPVIERNIALPSRVQARSWQYLSFHADACLLLLHALEAQFTSGADAAAPHWRELERLVIERERDMNPVFDVFLFLLSIRRKYRIPEFTALEDI